MKIVYLTNNINPQTGWGRYASDLVQGVKKAGHEAVVLKQTDDGFEGIPVLRKTSLISALSNLITIRKCFRNCDLIHALDGNPYAVIAAVASIGLGKKIVVTLQGTYAISPINSRWSNFMLKWAYRRADKILAISRYTRSEFLKKMGIIDVEVINHGIDFEKFYRPAKNRENYILTVGVVKYRKGYHVSIPAFALTKKKIPGLKYKIVGDWASFDYSNDLKILAKKHGVENDVEFISNISDEKLLEYYQKASLFILTSVNEESNFEGFGLVFLEAAAAGLPVIGTLGNGIEDSVLDGFNGILVPQNDIEKTAEAIVKLLEDKELLKKKGENSYLWAKEHSLTLVVKKYLDVYNRV